MMHVDVRRFLSSFNGLQHPSVPFCTFILINEIFIPYQPLEVDTGQRCRTQCVCAKLPSRQRTYVT
jgi:hypothetical protein